MCIFCTNSEGACTSDQTGMFYVTFITITILQNSWYIRICQGTICCINMYPDTFVRINKYIRTEENRGTGPYVVSSKNEQ